MRRLTAVLTTVFLAGTASAALAAGGGGGGMSMSPSMSGEAYDPSADYAHGVQAMQANNYRDAVRSFRRVTAAVPSNADAWRLLGQAAAGDNDWKQSRKAYEKAVKLSPNDYAAHGGLGLALAKLGDAKAQDELDWLRAKGASCGAGCPDADQVKAMTDQVQAAMGAAGAPKPSASVASPMIFAGAAAGDLAYSTAVSLINEHRYDDALASLQAAEAVFGPHPDILTYEGYAWRKKGDYARAETYYRQVLAIAPQHRGATEYYGELKVERGDMTGARTLLAKLDTICTFGCAEAEELRRWIDHGGDPQPR